MNNSQVNNIENIQRAEQASAIRGAFGPYIQGYIDQIVSFLVAHYRGGQLSHDMMVGKIAEISSLMAFMDHLDSDMRAGDAARDREYGHGSTAPQQATSPGTRSRSKST
jgi:hypothetical protein